MSKKIHLINSDKYAVVDDEDYEIASRFRWHLKKKGGRCYARCKMYMGRLNGKSIGCSIYLHRLIMRPSSCMQIDHKDHNGLNCKRVNMRSCTNGQNKQNCHSAKGSSSKYKGVCWDKRSEKWYTRIKIKGKEIKLGTFNNELEAALAYDRAATKYFGEFACLNQNQMCA